MIELTPKLIYEDLYASAYKDLLMYGLAPDQASRKANIYCVNNTWRFFTSEDLEAQLYRTLFYAKLSQSYSDKLGFLEDLDRLLELKETDETVS